jgi:hypothetical protein
MRLAKLSAVAGLVLCCGGVLNAQEQGAAVSGRVTDDQGRPLPGVEVTLLPGSAFARTDRDGQFRMNEVRWAAYALRLRHLGYSPLQLNVVVDSSEVRVGTLSLQRAAQRLDTVEVSADALEGRLARVVDRQRRGYGSVLYAEDIARKGYADTRDVLNDPSILRRLLGSRLDGRGSRFGRQCGVHIYVDGKPWSAARRGVSGRALLDDLAFAVRVEDIEAIEAHNSLHGIRDAAYFESGVAFAKCARLVLIWTRHGQASAR